MTDANERNTLRLIHAIVLLEKRARRLNCSRLTRALNDAGYYAGRALGRTLMEDRERNARAALEPKP